MSSSLLLREIVCVFVCSLLITCSCFHMHRNTKYLALDRRTVRLHSTQELLRETLELKNVSSIFLFDATRFGLDTALADGLKNLGDFKEAEEFAIEVGRQKILLTFFFRVLNFRPSTSRNKRTNRIISMRLMLRGY